MKFDMVVVKDPTANMRKGTVNLKFETDNDKTTFKTAQELAIYADPERGEVDIVIGSIELKGLEVKAPKVDLAKNKIILAFTGDTRDYETIQRIGNLEPEFSYSLSITPRQLAMFE